MPENAIKVTDDENRDFGYRPNMHFVDNFSLNMRILLLTLLTFY